MDRFKILLVLNILILTTNTIMARTLLNAENAISDYKKIELIRDDSGTSPKEILFFTGSDEIIPLQKSIINKLPNVNFTILGSLATGITEDVYGINNMNAKNVRFIPYKNYLTDWTQDRILRMRDAETKEMMPSIVFSKHLKDNEYSPYELGALDALRPYFEFKEHNELYIQRHVVDKSNAAIFNYHPRYDSWFQGESLKIAYGDGGDRLTTKSLLFIGKTTLKNMVNQVKYKFDLGQKSEIDFLEKIFKKKIIPIDADDTIDRYSFHIDVYMSAIDDQRVFLGSPILTIDEVLNINSIDEAPSFIDKNFWRQKIKKYQVVKDQLIQAGLEVIDVPILYLEVDGPYNSKRIADVTFTNGFYDYSNFHSTNYHFQDELINSYITKAESVFTKIAKKQGINAILHEGAENNLAFGGEARCTTSILQTNEN